MSARSCLVPYFDHNATTPLTSAAREAWLRAQDDAWQNPSSPYRAGARVKVRLDAARATLAPLLDADPGRLVFTGGATEAADAIFAHLARTSAPEAKVALNPTEHPCVLAAAQRWWGNDRLVWLPVTREGVVDPKAVAGLQAERQPLAAVVVMAANNETGVVQPWPELARVARQAAVPFVCDASQWLGKLPAGGLAAADWTFGAAHKFGGPKGVGFLVRPASVDGFVVRSGGGQERGQRGGTEDYPAIAAMVAALSYAEQSQMLFETERLRWRADFEHRIKAALPGVRIVAESAERLWNTVALVLPHGDNHRWVARLDARQVQISTGSACATGKSGPSHVLQALGYSADDARRVVRVSAGWPTTLEDWTALHAALVGVAPETKPAAAVIAP